MRCIDEGAGQGGAVTTIVLWYKMASPGQPQSSFPAPHTCHHCSNFVLYLTYVFDEAQANADYTAHPPNPSQEQLAGQLFGDDFLTEEWTDYRNYFFERTALFSFFDATKEDLERFARDGCLLSQRYVASFGDELPERCAFGAMVQRTDHRSIELGRLDLDDLRWEMLLAEDDEEPDNTCCLVAPKGTR